MRLSTVILAAGQGTRMRSSLPKVLHPILGKYIAWYALEAARQVTQSRPVMVIGHGADLVRQALGDQAEYVLQHPQLGTGHAVMQAEPLLAGKTDLVLVIYADMPLLTAQTLGSLVDLAQSHTGSISMLTVTTDDARGFQTIHVGHLHIH
jgi:bifunctional UDP-N-acetylglucosamine pyrophosphorylase/glucosamine-1-phosphate N-acetyltransferase